MDQIVSRKFALQTEPFKDNKLNKAYIDFVDEMRENRVHGQDLGRMLKPLKTNLPSMDMADITWSFCCEQLQAHQKEREVNIWCEFLMYLVERKLYKGKYAKALYDRRDEFRQVFRAGSIRREINKWGAAITPYSVVTAECVLTKTTIRRVAAIPNATKEFNTIIAGFVENVRDSYGGKSVASSTFNMLELVFGDYQGDMDHLSDYNDETFLRHVSIIVEYWEHKPSRDTFRMRAADLGQIIGFYVYIQSQMTEKMRNRNFKMFDSTMLKYQKLQHCLLNGYEFVIYNIYNNPPDCSKMAINLKQMYTRGVEATDKPIMFDISAIKNKKLRKWVMECFWFDTDHVIATRGKVYSPIIEFAILVSERYDEDAENVAFTLDDVINYKRNQLARTTKDSNVSRKLSMVRYFLHYLEIKDYIEVDALLYRMLVHKDSESEENKDAYTKEEIDKLTKEYKKYADEHSGTMFGILYEELYYIFMILSASEIRLSNLLNAHTDSIQKTLTRKGKNEYKLVISAKDSGDSDHEYNITHYVKELLAEVIELTADLRSEAMGNEADCIFIYKRKSHNSIAVIRAYTVREHHKRICELAGVKVLPIGGIRNTYTQAVGKHLAKKGYDPLMAEKITQHSHRVQLKYYDKPDILEFCERFYQVEIGELDISGKIVEDMEMDPHRTVMNGCGYCDLDKCALHGSLDCLMCKSFVTTPSCMPFFEQRIKDIDKAMICQNIQHEKEFLNSKKKLCVAYIEHLMEFEESTNDK